MFILQHHLQHSIIGFRMSSKIPFLTLDTGEALWKKIFPMEKNSEDQAKSFEDKCAFFHFFIFCLIILTWILATLTSKF